MAFEVPVARSYQQTLGDMSNVFASRYGILRLKVGGPILTGFEAVAQSQMRCTQDIFNLLDLSDYSRLEGTALDFRAAEDGVYRRGAAATTGSVSFIDPRFTRIASRVYAGTPPPSAGSTILRVADAFTFPSTGVIYIGRGTINAEGPLTYSAKAQVGQYWQLTLSSPTTKFHNLNEDVVVGQGGNRAIAIGTTVSTAKDGRSAPVTFATTQLATILDGETTVLSVPIVSQTPGVIGNVPRGAIQLVTGSPFPQASCSNTLDLNNGLNIESDSELRDRLRAERASKSRGTATSILFGTQGLYSSEDQKRVLSASLIQPAGEAAVLYIDDGTGYEETNSGIPYEVLADSASGGEFNFALSGRRPIAKAYLISTLQAPFSLVTGAQLQVLVGGTLVSHTFDSSDFTAISSATAQEIVSSINSNPDITFSARTSDSGSRVTIFARSNVNEDLQIVQPSAPLVDANDYLGLSTSLTYTLKLYKNDQLLYKDGRPAVVNSSAQTFWGSMTSGIELRISVDGTAAQTYTFVDADFVTARTLYTTVSQTNSLASWIAVINLKIPGITAADGGGFLTFTSNLGSVARASVSILSSTNPNFITAGVFTSAIGLSSTGLSKDFTLNRQTGDLQLVKPLAVGDTLTAGSYNTRGYVVSADIPSASVTFNSTGRVWVSLDGDAVEIVPNTSGTTTWDVTSGANNRTTYTASTATAFGTVSNILSVGDYIVLWDPALLCHGHFRICQTATSAPFNFVVVEKPPTTNQTAVALLSGGVKFFRTSTTIQCLRFARGSNRTLASIVAEANGQLTEGAFEVYRNTKVRLRTNAYNTTGDAAVLTADTEGQRLQLPRGKLASSTQAHVGALVSGNPEVGTFAMGWGAYPTTPTFVGVDIGADLGAASGFSWGFDISPSHLIYFPRKATPSSTAFYGNAVGRHFTQSRGGFIFPQRTSSLRKPDLPQVVTSLTRTANVVTVVTPAGHNLAVGDQVWIDFQTSADANFVRGVKLVTSTASATTFTYAENGSNATNATPYVFNIWDGTLGFTAVANDEDYTVFTRPYAIGAYCDLNMVIDNDYLNQSYGIPMYRRGRFGGSTLVAGTPMPVVDVDNGGATFSSTFGTTNPNFFQDFHVYLRARTVTHKNTIDKSILWRMVRYGIEGEAWYLRYVNPTSSGQGFGYTTSMSSVAITTVPYVQLDISLPSGSARAVTGLEAGTRFTWVVTSFGSYKQVVFTYSTINITSGNLSRTSNVVTANTATQHGFQTGDVVYITSADVNFPSGAKVIIVTGVSAFTYSEVGANASSASLITANLASTAPSFVGVVVGDVVSIKQDGTNLLLPIGAYRVYAVGVGTFTIRVPLANTITTQATPQKLGNAANLEFFPINTAISTAALLKAYADASMSSLVTATLLGTGATIITQASEDEYYQAINNTSVATTPYFVFISGMSWVESSNLAAGPNTLTLKLVNSIDPNASTVQSDVLTSDVSNEEFRLVPANAVTLRRWLLSPAVSGIYAGANVDVVGRDSYLQISSKRIGSGGSVAVTSGLANSISTPLLSTGENVEASYGRVTIGASQALGIHGDQYVVLENTLPTSKDMGLTGASTVTVTAAGLVTLSSDAYTRIEATASFLPAAGRVTIYRVGRLTAYRFDSISSTSWSSTLDLRGRFFRFQVSEASSSNRIVSKRIVAYTPYDAVSGRLLTIWVENPSGIDEQIISNDVANVAMIYDLNSVQVGDTLSIGFPFGNTVQNQGQFTVTAIGPLQTQFTVNKTFAAAGPTALGTNLPLFQVTDPNLRIIERVRSVVPDSTGTKALLVMQQSYMAALIGKLNPNLGATLTALDKLQFPNDIAGGTDGYAVSTGLIGETVRTLYGDPNAPTLYPGLAAVGSTIYVSGPNVKRIKVSLQIRLRTGVTATTVSDRVRAAVAAQINRTPLGTAVALGLIVKAAQGVQGVSAASLLSPTFNSSNDVISVQANEKPFVFDALADIGISIVGASS